MDYFAVKQSYYTGDLKKTLQEIAKFGKTEDDTLNFYSLRCQLELKESITYGESKLAKAFQAYQSFLANGDLGAVASVIDEATTNNYELHLLASAHAIAGELDRSLELAVNGIHNGEHIGTTELFLLAIEVALLNNQNTVASTLFENYINSSESELSSEDELIVNLAESYIKFATNVDTSSSNFYYFEELAQTYPTWKSQLGLLSLHLQQAHVEEARSIVELLESEYYSEGQKDMAAVYLPHLLANKITLSILEAKPLEEIEELRNQLISLKPDHPYVKAHREMSAKFDEIVARSA